MSHDQILSAVVEWSRVNRDRVRHEAARRQMTVADFVVRILDDVLWVYEDQSDSEIAEEESNAVHIPTP